jgi:hypothetical protein
MAMQGAGNMHAIAMVAGCILQGRCNGRGCAAAVIAIRGAGVCGLLQRVL